MNNYPPGRTGRMGDCGVATLHCPYGHPNWEARGFEELGRVYYANDSDLCPECGEPGLVDRPVPCDENNHDYIQALAAALGAPGAPDWRRVLKALDHLLRHTWIDDGLLDGATQQRMFHRLGRLARGAGGA